MDFPYGKLCLTKKEKLIFQREIIPSIFITFPFLSFLPVLAILSTINEETKSHPNWRG
jgi:hypothetical protein